MTPPSIKDDEKMALIIGAKSPSNPCQSWNGSVKQGNFDDVLAEAESQILRVT